MFPFVVSHQVIKPALSRILESIKESKEKEELNKSEANKKIKELEEKLGKMEPRNKDKKAVAPSAIHPLQLVTSLWDLFVWSGPKHSDLSTASSKYASAPKKSLVEVDDDEEPLKIQRRRGSKGRLS